MANKKTTTYNSILKEFTKINSKLSEEKKLSIAQRRQIIKENILPLYKDTPKYKQLGVRKLRALIKKQINLVPPKEICDLNYIDTSEYAFVEWFSLDETIRELVPNCVYVKVSAGEFGETRLFNTRNYEYGKKGVRRIVEAIRPDAENSSGKYIFSGYQKLRKGKKNNGKAENYYLDLVLFIIDKDGGSEPQGGTESVKFDLGKSREVRKKKTKIKNIIEAKIKLLKAKRDSKRRAKKTLEKNIDKFTKAVKKVSRSKKPSANAKALARKQFAATSKLVEKYYKEGKLTKYQYDKALEKLFKEFNQ
jgi:hypothetical protein